MVATRLNNRCMNGMDTISPESVDRALTVLLRAVLNPAMVQSSEALHADAINRLQYCIEQSRLEASEGASWWQLVRPTAKRCSAKPKDISKDWKACKC